MYHKLITPDLSNPLIQLLTKHSSEITIILDKFHNIMLFNPVAENMFNCMENEVVGTGFDMLCCLSNIENFLTKALSKSINNSIYTTINNFNLSWQIFPLVLNDNSFYVLKAIILEEKENQDELIRLETLIENMPCNVFWMDKNCVMLGCNRNVLSMLNITREQYIGKTYEELSELCHWPQGLAQNLKNDVLQVLKTGQPIFGIEEPPIPYPNHTSLNFLTSRVPIRNNTGEVIGVAGISVEISELRNSREKAEDANRAKTEFIANMSHDIRTPLNGVIGVADLLRKNGVSQEDRTHGQMIYLASRQLLELLNSVLDVVSLEHISETDINEETFNLSDLLQRLHDLMNASTKVKGIQLTFDIDDKLPHYIRSDRLKIERILQNLLGNAIKFTTIGEVVLQARVLDADYEWVQIEFRISDTGIGIPENQQHHIFDRFFRASPSYEGKYQGYGVGLYIVKKFVTLLGGELSVDSELDKGTSFTFRLKMKIGKKDETKTLAVREDTPKYERFPDKQTSQSCVISTESACILFIEDNEIARHTGQILLQNSGYHAHVEETAESAIAILKSQAFDLIITDLGLPGIQGDEMTCIIRYLEKITKKDPVPVYALTAHADDYIKQNCLVAGINQVFMKPLDDRLLKEILTHYRKHSLPSDRKHEPLQSELAKDSASSHHNLFKLDDFPIFDLQDGIIKAGSQSLLNDMLTLMRKRVLPDELNNLKNAFQKNDWEKICKIAHKIKGGAVYCGTVRMAYACQYLEKSFKENKITLLDSLYHQLLNTIEQTQDQLEFM